MRKSQQQLDKYVEMINKGLNAYLQINDDITQKTVFEAMRYSTLYGGKRIRGILVLAFCKLTGGRVEDALPFACAIELIHSYSLVHDDLPSMDNDDVRRGQPATHIEYGEAIAILAGDGLLTKAFEVISKADLPPKLVVEALSITANLSGIDGMIGGQVIDLESENKRINEETLKELQILKTGSLISASATLGCIAGNSTAEIKSRAFQYGKYLGLCFQIVDDILDKTSSTDILGKPINSDGENIKTTFVTAYGLEESQRMAEKYSKRALDILEEIDGDNKEFLVELTNSLLKRKN